MVSIIIPTYNESRVIGNCLRSLQGQSLKDLEIIVVDDGSTDDTVGRIKYFVSSIKGSRIRLFSQEHKGPGNARNLAASKAKGDILVFIDADMTFEPEFIAKVVAPIKGSVVGTDSQSGVLSNPQNYWARMWNLGKFAAAGNYSRDFLTEVTPNKKDFGGVFRAILKKEFLKVGGFDTDGDYTDDTSLARKLGVKAKIVSAKFNHANPDTLPEVWIRASWIGSGKNFTSHRYFNLFRFFPLFSIPKGLIIGSRFKDFTFVFFKIVYDTAVWISLLSVVTSFPQRN